MVEMTSVTADDQASQSEFVYKLSTCGGGGNTWYYLSPQRSVYCGTTYIILVEYHIIIISHCECWKVSLWDGTPMYSKHPGVGWMPHWGVARGPMWIQWWRLICLIIICLYCGFVLSSFMGYPWLWCWFYDWNNTVIFMCVSTLKGML